MAKEKINDKILSNNSSREKCFLSPYACSSNRGIRKKEETISDRDNIRPSFFHDTDRIIHSNAYSRYIDKTQVFYLFENDHITHRVLHVQLVSKIGRTIGRFLKLNEDLIEAISLGHDIGHVPYGHDGEQILNGKCKSENIGFFCHNAQSVRFLQEIEKKGEGLNLTLQVLDGILSHNGEIIKRVYNPRYEKTWDTFEEEYFGCFHEEGYDKKLVPMTLEGCVMRISDIIAYVGRDIEDAIVVGLTNRNNIPKEITKNLGNTNRVIINKLVMDLTHNSYNKNYISFSEDVFKALDDLKQFNYENIYKNEQIRTQNYKIERMFKLLYEEYHSDLLNSNKSSSIYTDFLDNMNDTYKKNTPLGRQVIDFMAGMTDDFFNNQFQSIFVPKKYGYKIENNKK